MSTFRKKTPAFEAMQWDGGDANPIVTWAQGGWKIDGIYIKQKFAASEPLQPLFFLAVPAFGAEQDAAPGDWILKGEKDGQLSVLSAEEFAASFEEVTTP